MDADTTTVYYQDANGCILSAVAVDYSRLPDATPAPRGFPSRVRRTLWLARLKAYDARAALAQWIAPSYYED